MSELSASDVEEFTSGRLVDDALTQAILDAALVTARRHCGWHVSPVRVNDEVVLDGPESRILNLPTRKLIALTSVEEDSNLVDLSTLRWSAGGPPGILDRPVGVRKRSGGFWPCHYMAVTVTMTHGYTENEAADWRFAILSMVDRISMTTMAGATGGGMLTGKRIDDVAYTWASPLAGVGAENALYSVESILCNYELPRIEYL